MAFRASEFRLILIAQNRASNTLRSVSRDLRALEQQGKSFGSRFAYASTVVGDLGRTMALFGGVTTGVLAVAANSAAQFNTQIGLIATQTDNMRATSRLAYKEILNDMTQFPASADEMTASLYDIYSGTQLVGKGGTQALKLFNKAAVAGQVDLNTATNAGITVLNNYGNSAKDLPKLLNQMFSAVRFGRMTFEQFSNSLNQIVPAFATTHQSVLDMLGSFAFLTRQMPSTSMAATSLSRAIETLATPKMAEGLKKVGVNIRDVKGNLLPLKDIIGLILQRFPKLASGEMNVETFLKQMTNQQGYIQARRGLTQLFQHYKDFIKVDRQVRQDTNEFNRSYKRLAETAGVQWGIFVNQLHAAAILLGTAVLPTFLQLVKPVRELIKGFMDLDDSTKATIGRFVAIGALGTTIAGVFLSVTAGITGFIALMLASGAALTAFLTVAGGLAAFAGLALLVYRNWDSVKSFLVRYWPDIQHAAETAGTAIKRAVDDISNVLGHMVGMIGEIIRGDWRAVWNDFVATVTNAFDLLKLFGSGVKGVFSAYMDMATSSVQGFTAALLILGATIRKLAIAEGMNSIAKASVMLFGGKGVITNKAGEQVGTKEIPGIFPAGARMSNIKRIAQPWNPFAIYRTNAQAAKMVMHEDRLKAARAAEVEVQAFQRQQAAFQRESSFISAIGMPGVGTAREGEKALALGAAAGKSRAAIAGMRTELTLAQKAMLGMRAGGTVARNAITGIGTALAGLVGLTGPQGAIVLAGVGIGLMVYAILQADKGFTRLADNARDAANAIRDMDSAVKNLTGSFNNLPTNIGDRIVALGDLHNINAQIGQARGALSVAKPGRAHQAAEDALNSLLQQRADILGQIKGMSGTIAKNFADFGKGINEFNKRTTRLSTLRSQLHDYRVELQKLNNTTPTTNTEAGRQRARMEELKNAIKTLRGEIGPLNADAQKLGAGLRKNVGGTLRDLGTRGIIPKLNAGQMRSAIQAVIQHPPRNLRELKLEVHAVLHPQQAARQAAKLKARLQRDFPTGKPSITPVVKPDKAVRSTKQLMNNLAGMGSGGATTLGLAISAGIASGVTSGSGAIVTAATSAVYDALNAARTAIGAKSPSKLFAEKVGKPMIQGISKGMLKEAGGMKAAIKSIVDTMVQTFKDLLEENKGFFGDLFGGIPGAEGPSFQRKLDWGQKLGIKDLSQDLTQQMAHFHKWNRTIQTIMHNVPHGAKHRVAFFQALQAMGPEALPELQALANASPSQIRHYLHLWNQSQKMIQHVTHQRMNMQMYQWQRMGKRAAFGLLTGLKDSEPELVRFFRRIARAMFPRRRRHGGHGGGAHAGDVHYHYHAPAHGDKKSAYAHDKRSRFDFERHIRKLPRP